MDCRVSLIRRPLQIREKAAREAPAALSSPIAPQLYAATVVNPNGSIERGINRLVGSLLTPQARVCKNWR